MSSFLREYLEMLDEARRDPNLKGMGNLNSLDSGLKRLLLTKVDQYYKFDSNDPKRSTLQAGFGTGSELKALPGVTAATTPYKVLDTFKDTKEIKALVIEIGGQQVGLVFKQHDSKASTTTFSVGISSVTHKLATKDVAEADVANHAIASKKDAIKYAENNKHSYTKDEHEERLREIDSPESHASRVSSARSALEAAALEKLTKKAFTTGRNTINGWQLSRGMASGLPKQRTSEWLTHLIEFVRAELKDPKAEVRYIGITADPEREKLHKEREAAKRGVIPRDEEGLYMKKALKLGKFDALEKSYYKPEKYKKYVEDMKKQLKQRAEGLRVSKANSAAVTVDSASDLHKLLVSGKFHDKFKLVVDGKAYVYNFYDDRNLSYGRLVQAAKRGEKTREHDTPYIIFHVDKKEDDYSSRKEFRDKQREVAAKVEAGELTPDDASHQLETIERELMAKMPPDKIMLFMKLSGYGLIVDEIGLQPAGSWSDYKRDLIMFKVEYDDKGVIKGMQPISKAEVLAAADA